MLAIHGDGLMESSLRATLLHRLINHPITAAVYRSLHPELGLRLVRAGLRLGLGEHGKALDDCNEALRLRPDDPGARKLRGVVWAAHGDWANALNHRQPLRVTRSITSRPTSGQARLIAAAR